MFNTQQNKQQIYDFGTTLTPHTPRNTWSRYKITPSSGVSLVFSLYRMGWMSACNRMLHCPTLKNDSKRFWTFEQADSSKNPPGNTVKFEDPTGPKITEVTRIINHPPNAGRNFYVAVYLIAIFRLYLRCRRNIYSTCLVCFFRVIVFFGGPYRLTGFCCIWHHHEILVCSDIKNCKRKLWRLLIRRRMKSSFCDTESMEQQKARSRQRNGLGIALVGRLGSHSQRRIQATRLSVLIGRMQWACLWMLRVQLKQKCRPVAVIKCLWACSEQALGSSILTISLEPGLSATPRVCPIPCRRRCRKWSGGGFLCHTKWETNVQSHT